MKGDERIKVRGKKDTVVKWAENHFLHSSDTKYQIVFSSQSYKIVFEYEFCNIFSTIESPRKLYVSPLSYIQVASEDEPQSLAEAEQLLNKHASIREEIDGYAEDYNKMRAMGDRVTQDQTDPQYMFLRQVGMVFIVVNF